MNLLENQTALITGTAQGIGRAIALRYISEGARVFGMDLDERRNAETATLAGAAFSPLKGDVSMAADVAEVVRRCGPVDILVNNAATVAGDGRLDEIGEETWDRVVEVCLKSVYLCSRAVLPGMMERRRGVIISLSSVNALMGVHLAAYTAAKGGILSLTRLMAQQYGPFGIRTNAICPGTILTETSRIAYEAAPALRDELLELYPGRAFGEPEDIAECALWLAGPGAQFVNGATIVVDGGATALHRLPSLERRPDRSLDIE
jgi:3-oxoacyl-[acyl-carrier protein] reductase